MIINPNLGSKKDNKYESKKNIFSYYFLFLLLLFSLYSVSIASNFKLSDLAMIIFIITSLCKFKKIYIGRFNIIYLIWFILSISSSFFLFSHDYFNHDKFIYASLRSALGIISGFLIPLWLKTEDNKIKIILVIKKVIIIHILIQFLFYTLFTLGMTQFFNIIPHGDQFNRGEWLNIYNYTSYYRFGGIFEEPSWYCWFMIFLIGIIVSYERIHNITIISKKIMFLIYTSFILTFSIAGIASLTILSIIKYDLFSRSLKNIILLVIFFILLCLIYLYYKDITIFERLTLILTGNDGSSNTRVLGSLFRVYYVLKNTFIGTGLGNSIQGISYYSTLENIYYNSTISNQNGYIEAFVSTGFLGGIIYLTPIFSLLFNQKTRIVFITITLVFFTTSAIFNSAIWFLLFLSYYIMKSEADIKNENTSANIYNE